MKPWSPAPVDSATARITLGWPQMPRGRKRHSYYPCSCLLHTGHVYVQEVLHGVLYPEAHINGFKKKKRTLGSRHQPNSNPSGHSSFIYNILDLRSTSLTFGAMSRSSQKAPLLNRSSREKFPLSLGLVSPGVRPYLELIRFHKVRLLSV